MKLIKSLANATFDINCFESREDVLRKFDDGQRHDTPYNRWPIVPNDPDTGFPRRLQRAEVVGMSKWTNDTYATEAIHILERWFFRETWVVDMQLHQSTWTQLG